MPVGIGLGISGILLSMYLEGTKTLISIPQTIFSSGNSFLLSAIPLFILMSEILKKANIIQILFDTVNKAFLSKNTNNLSEVWIGSSESNFIPLDWVDVKSGNLK